MIDWISEWIKNIVFVILLATFVDLLLPNTSMQKYARIVLGMLIVLIIITPILELFGNTFSISAITQEFENNYPTGNTVTTIGSIDSIKQKAENDYQEKIREQVEINMEQNLKKLLENKLNIVINNLVLKTEIIDGIWDINQIIVYAATNSTDNDDSSIKVVEDVNVKKITLGKEDSSVVNDEKDKENQKIVDEIIEIIEKEWDIKREKIVVYLELDMK